MAGLAFDQHISKMSSVSTLFIKSCCSSRKNIKDKTSLMRGFPLANVAIMFCGWSHMIQITGLPCGQNRAKHCYLHSIYKLSCHSYLSDVMHRHYAPDHVPICLCKTILSFYKIYLLSCTINPHRQKSEIDMHLSKT